MGLFIQQNEKRSDLQQRLDAELREKAKKQAELRDAPDGVDDSKYLENTKTTTGLAGVWVAIVLFAIAVFVYFVVANPSMANGAL